MDLAEALRGRPDDLYGEPAPTAVAAYVHACCDRSESAAVLAARWLAFVQGGRGFYTSWTWPFAAIAFHSLGRASELAAQASKVAIQTLWIEAAQHLVGGRSAAAKRVLADIGAPGVTTIAIEPFNEVGKSIEIFTSLGGRADASRRH